MCTVRMVVFFTLLVTTIAVAQQPPAPSPLQQASTKVLREMPVRLYEGKATEVDLAACQKLYDMAPNEKAKRPFLLLGAQYQRLALQKPERTLAILAPQLIGKEKANEWNKANGEAVKAALSKWKMEAAAAKRAKKDPPPEPLQYLVDFPPLADWTVNADTAPLAVEAAHCLAALDKAQEALKVIDAIGQQYTDETRVLAAECGADLFVRMQMYERSIEFYGFALNVLDTLKQKEYDPGKGERIFFSEEQAIIHRRLAEKRGLAQRLYDEERFGPDWVAYRDAQRHHHGERYLDAYFAYMELMREYPDTVYSEAANCYLIEILCKLADKANVQDQGKIFKERQKQLVDTKQRLAMGLRFHAPQQLLDSYKKDVERLEKSLEMWKRIPLGIAAIEAAESETKKFVERDKFGLYRGEAMLNVGLCWLETFLEPERAQPWLEQANAWFDEVKKLDMALTKLEVPDKSRGVSTPPRTERFTDEWTNVKMSRPKAGDLFNRRECSWYVSAKHKDAVLWLGFLRFIDKNYDGAKKYWEIIAEIDKEFYGQQAAKGWGEATVFGRLKWNLENQPGCLYATPKEMGAFKDKRRRLAVTVADLHYEAEQRDEALRMFRRLENNEFGPLSQDERAYVTLGVFACLCWMPGQDEIAYIEQKLKLFEGTPSEKRVMYSYANRLFSTSDPKKLLKALINQMRNDGEEPPLTLITQLEAVRQMYSDDYWYIAGFVVAAYLHPTDVSFNHLTFVEKTDDNAIDKNGPFNNCLHNPVQSGISIPADDGKGSKIGKIGDNVLSPPVSKNEDPGHYKIRCDYYYLLPGQAVNDAKPKQLISSMMMEYVFDGAGLTVRKGDEDHEITIPKN